MPTGSRAQKGQAIVLVALILVALFGFLGLAMDGGRGYLDRRGMQGAVDAAALAAAYNYMNNTSYILAEQAATTQFANNQRLYTAPTCSGYGTANVTCTFGDPSNQVLTLTVADRSIAGTTFTATAVHQIPVTIMRVLGAGAMTVGATATAVARRAGSNGAAIQTLAPLGCPGGGNSLTFQGNSTTTVIGDIWSNGNIFEQSGSAGGTVNGNVIDVCPPPPNPLTTPKWSITGAQVNGINTPDPGYAVPPIDATSRSWASSSGSVELAGTYNSDPHLGGGAGCYFLGGGVYNFTAGYTQLGGFTSNELRPPDEPNLTATSAALTGTITSIPVAALAVAVPANSIVRLNDQAFTVTSAGAAVAATSIPVAAQAVTGTLASGTIVVTMARALHQFWDMNGVGCGSSFSLTALGSSGLASGTYSAEVTAVRWEPNGVSSCSGPASSTCYLRESAPSMCRTVTLASSGNIRVSVTSVPGAQDYFVYLAQNSTCTGLTYCTNVGSGGSSSVTINSCLSGQSPPDTQRLPLAGTLPNTNPAAGVPPRGDLANEGHCVTTTLGNNTACPSPWTPGAVVFYVPSGGCIDLHGGADSYLFSGYQYGRTLIFEPGPIQSATPNTCSNTINGNGFTSLIGIVYAPAANVQVNGSNSYQATIAGGVIAWTATITGNGAVAITADPTLRAFPSAVRLIQ
jgi:Flp pilus assembly protein TadG